MESKCRQALLDGVYNMGYATSASIAAVVGCTEADAHVVLSTVVSSREYHLLIISLEHESHGLMVQLSIHPSLQESGIPEKDAPRVLAAVSHSFIALHDRDAFSMWSAIVTKECEEMMANPTYGMLHANITTDQIRQAMEDRNKQLQVTDNDLVRYSHELFYAVMNSDACGTAGTNPHISNSHSSMEPVTWADEPSIKKIALQGVSSTVVSNLVIAEDGSLETVHKEVAIPPANKSKPKPKPKQKPAACDIMSFVKKRDSN